MFFETLQRFDKDLTTVMSHQQHCQYYIFGTSRAYLGHILGISWAYLGHILGISRAYLGHILGISWAYPGYISGISRAYLGHILGGLCGHHGKRSLEVMGLVISAIYRLLVMKDIRMKERTETIVTSQEL